MSKFTKYSHQKTSSTKQGRLNHFLRLKGKHTQNSFILVGPHNHSYLGGVAVQFQPLNYQKKKPVIDCQESEKTKQINNKPQTDEANLNKPKQKMTEVIELSDSDSSEPTQDFLSELPLIPIYNIDKKYYTPTFLFPNGNSKDEECRKNFMHKIQQAKKEIAAEQIMQPRPRNKHLYCGVCKEPFEQYLGHVRGKTHQDKSRKSPFAQHIKALELQMNIGSCKKQREKQWRRIKAKQERLRKKEEETGKRADEDLSKKQQLSEQEKNRQGEQNQQKIKGMQCKLQANMEHSPAETSSNSSSSEKVKKSKKPRKRRQNKRQKKKCSSSRSESNSRSRQKKVKKQMSSGKKNASKVKVQQGKKKRGRPSKKDIEMKKEAKYD